MIEQGKAEFLFGANENDGGFFQKFLEHLFAKIESMKGESVEYLVTVSFVAITDGYVCSIFF
mgnify:CR=1 FL=1